MEKRFRKNEAIDDDSTLVTSRQCLTMFDNVKFIISLFHIQAHSLWSLVLLYFTLKLSLEF